MSEHQKLRYDQRNAGPSSCGNLREVSAAALLASVADEEMNTR